MKIKTGSDFSGVGAFDQALNRLGIKQNKIFACDMDKYARQTYILNYGEPKYYPENVYNREIPKESLDVYMTSPPCQSFSLAGKRKGEDSDNGVLFYNSHEFIKVNKPRYFIFENVKGLLSDNSGKTFRRWLDYLGGKSVNGNPLIFPHEESVPYHIYYKVINAKKCGVPQNRERVFIVGIRDDVDNTFTWDKDVHLDKRLKDVLESEVDEKYYLSDKMINYLTNAKRAVGFTDVEKKEKSNCLLATYYKMPTDGEYLKVKSATKQGFEVATPDDSINFSQPSSQTRRGRVGKEVAQTLDTACNQGVIIDCYNNNIKKDGLCGTITQHCSRSGMTNGMKLIKDHKIRRLTPRECFRLMDFPDSFKWDVSDSQAYKQAGNSIVVSCLVGILKKLNL
jgi:DNA (cytosine-5)-methyltransferase 1